MSASETLLPGALRSRLSFVLARLGGLARQECADQLAAAGLSQHQHAILCCLDEYGPACQKDVALRLGIDSGDIVAYIDGLQAKGLTLRERDERDRRRQIVSITASGTRALRKVEGMLDAAEPGILAALTEAERGELQRWAVRVLARQAPAGWAEPQPLSRAGGGGDEHLNGRCLTAGVRPVERSRPVQPELARRVSVVRQDGVGVG
jgi:MarR family transcriptional regulator, lower aerobic nicotinate degradation pathway regulator